MSEIQYDTDRESINDRLYLLINFFLSKDELFWNKNPEEFHAVYQELCDIKLNLSSNV